ncbi:Lactation elevated protein 1 [Ananas comosus]|uniref:Lactation elevated protein 1 n=1 Tax=Ananas comosus TaxID=4615 RepID=A0A199VJT4_ANACO|nr:Lactation elevated protein 1 [Ananas comosus]
MRYLARSVWQLRHLSRVLGAEISSKGLERGWIAPVWISSVSRSLNGSFHYREITGYMNQAVVFVRTLSTSAANDATAAATDAARAGPLMEYEKRIVSGELVDGDCFQLDTLRLLQTLYDQLVEHEDACQLDRYNSSKKSGRSRWLWSRLIPQSSYAPVRGLYLYGGVGTGKTMLMDLFYEQLPSNWRKKRIHFHDFMLNVHSRLQKHKGLADPLEVVAAEISDESILLCLDEFMVTDVADALILNRLFRHLFNKGVVCIYQYSYVLLFFFFFPFPFKFVLVSTSNRAPDQLYEGGLQRDLFLPFIETLKERCIAHAIGSSTDYRKMGSAEQGLYLVGNQYGPLLKQKFHSLIGQEKPRPQVVEVVMGRKLQVHWSKWMCLFPFEELCDRPLGAADYFGLFKKFHTLALEGVPKFGLHNRTAAYRFVTLVDVCLNLYFPSSFIYEFHEENWLTEMNSKEYLEQHEANLHRSSEEAHDNGDMLQSRQLILD